MGRRPSLHSRMSPENLEVPAIEISSEDEEEEEEANEDLSLGILAKAKRNMRPPPLVLEIVSSDEDEIVASPAIRSLDQLEAEALENGKNTGLVQVSGSGLGSAASLEQEQQREKEKGKGPEVLEATSVSPSIGAHIQLDSKKKKKKQKKKKQKTSEGSHSSTPEVTQTETKELSENGAMQKLLADDQNQGLHFSVSDFARTGTKEVGDNAVMRKLLRGPRYFDPPEEQQCYHCGESGHVSVNCTMERRKKPCYVCGNVGHGAKDCHQGTECYICKKVGHIARNCTEQRWKGDKNIQNFNLCLCCGDVGHDMVSCQNGYDPEDLKQIQCYVCKCYGHLCCVDVMDSCAREPSCYNCGEKGHTGLCCAKERRGKGNEGPAKTCFRCGEEGHYARSCNRDANSDRWMPKSTNSGNGLSQEEANLIGFRSVPRNFGKLPQWTDMESEVRKAATPGDLRSHYGWKMDYEDSTNVTPHRMDTWHSPRGTLGTGGLEMGSVSNDHNSTSKMSKNFSPYTSNGLHHSYRVRNKHSGSKSKKTKRDGKRDSWRSH